MRCLQWFKGVLLRLAEAELLLALKSKEKNGPKPVHPHFGCRKFLRGMT